MTSLRCLSVFGLTCSVVLSVVPFGSTFWFPFDSASARLPIRTLASGCTLAPVLQNPSSVTSSDFDLVSKNTASSVATFRLPDHPPACRDASEARTRKTVRLNSAALYTLCLKKGTPTLSTVTLERINRFQRFLAQVFLKQLASNGYSISRLTQHLLLHYLGKTELMKYYILYKAVLLLC